MMNRMIENGLLTQLGVSRNEAPTPKLWSQAVQRLSNHYVAEPDSISPWRERWAREALLSYFHPLNQARAERVAGKGVDLGFFEGIEHMIDLGCGSAAASLGFLLALEARQPKASAGLSQSLQSLELVDHSLDITVLAKRLIEDSGLRPTELKASHQGLELFRADDIKPGTLLLLSYVLTEAHSAQSLRGLIRRLPGLEAIAILEPSTSQDARKLQALRPILIEAGFNLWAPCTHAGACPLLKDSDRDWCHDRLVPALPSWWDDLEAGLPMKNKTVTVSYLLARRTPRPPHEQEVRVIGDRLDEKTKVRQMICRGENREFISWFPSRLKEEAEDFELARGDLFLSKDSLWKDPRGIDRSKEYRLDLTAIRDITASKARRNPTP